MLTHQQALRTAFLLTIFNLCITTDASAAAEVWMTQGTSGAGLTGSGTQASPYKVPPDDASAYDSVIGGLSANTTLHIGAGLYLTSGYSTNAGYPDGFRVIGSGMGVTTLRLKANAIGSGQSATVIQIGTSGPSAKYTACVRDLTIDCNFINQHASSIKVNGVSYTSFAFDMDHVEVVELGGRNAEAFGIFGGHFGSGLTGSPSHVTIRNCRIHKPYTGSAAFITAIHPSGDNNWSGVVENCYIDLSAANYPSNGAQGLAFAGTPEHLVFRDNVVKGCTRGFHFDTPGSGNPHDVVISHNHFERCQTSIAFGWASESLSGVLYERFMIEGNSMEMKGGVGVYLSNRCRGFFVRDNTMYFTSDTNSGAYCHTVAVDNNCEGNVICGNRYGPSNVGNQVPFAPASYAPSAAATLKNEYTDNKWINTANGIKYIDGYRFAQPGNTLPAGTGFWRLSLGCAQNDWNPSTEIVSSDHDQSSNYYSYMRLGRANSNPWGSYNVLLDPAGTSGAWVGTQTAGNFGAGGWVQGNTGFFLPQGSRMVNQETGSAARMGLATLGSGGEVTVSTTSVRSDSRIFLTIQSPSATVGSVRIESRTAGASFKIKSTDSADRSQVAWFMIDPSF